MYIHVYSVLPVFSVLFFRTKTKQGTKRRTACNDVDIEILRQLKETREEDDEDHLFGLSIAATLKKLEPQKKSLAKLRLQQVLYEVEYLPFHASSTPSSSYLPGTAAYTSFSPYHTYSTPTQDMPINPNIDKDKS